jgi:hypothetical protein
VLLLVRRPRAAMIRHSAGCSPASSASRAARSALP